MKYLQTKIILILLSISLLPLLVFTVYSSKITENIIHDKVNNASMSTLQTISHSVDSELFRLLSEMTIATNSKEFQHIANGLRSAKTDGETWVLLRELDSLMLGIIGKSPSVLGIYLTLPNGESYAVSDGYRIDMSEITKQSWFQSTKNNNGTLRHCGITTLGKEQKKALIFGRVLRDTSDLGNLEHIGSIHFAINPLLFTALSIQGNDDGFGTFWLFDAQDRLLSEENEFAEFAQAIYNQNKDEIIFEKNGTLSLKTDGKPVVLLYDVSTLYQYRILNIIPTSTYVAEMSRIAWTTVIFSICCAVVVIALSATVSRSISKPILELNKAMKRTEGGNLDITLPVKRKDEIGQVIRGFNKMVVKLKNVFEKSIENEKKKKELEISALQYQINPHFLYNLLASIRSLALVEGAIETDQMLETAAKLLKSTIGQAGTMITLEQELQNIERFLYIQNLCHNGTVQWKIDIPDECKWNQIPNLILQPIVENSVFYGVNPETGWVKLQITASIQDDILILCVSDNGPGIEKEKLDGILETSDVKNGLTHVGLKNTNDRIKLNFGEGYGIKVYSDENGTRVSLSLPYTPPPKPKEEFLI